MGARHAVALYGSFDYRSGRAEHPNLFPGVTTLANIGKGSFSEVYRCVVTGIEGEVAVKVLRPWLSRPAHREVQTLNQAGHPNIVRLLKVLRADGSDSIGLVFELCVGGTLAEVLHGTVRVPPKSMRLSQRLQACYQVALALEHLHSQQIMHRDIKTLNVFLADIAQPDGDGVVLPQMKLGDLGLAKILEDNNPGLNTQFTGTLAYMAPEVLAGDFYCMPADIFSFAIMLHETASGELPYGLSQRPRLAAKILDGLRPPRDQLPAGHAGDEVFALLGRCWCREQEERLLATAVLSEMQALLSTVVEASG